MRGRGRGKAQPADLGENLFPFSLAPLGKTESKRCSNFFSSLNHKKVPSSYHPLCSSPVSRLPNTPVPILITPNSVLNKVFIRLAAFVFPFLLIKSGNVGKKYGWVTRFLMVPHLKCILKYVNQ